MLPEPSNLYLLVYLYTYTYTLQHTYFALPPAFQEDELGYGVMNSRPRPAAVVRRAELRELDVALERLAHPAASRGPSADFLLVDAQARRGVANERGAALHPPARKC
jgi:hypothetical protein